MAHSFAPSEIAPAAVRASMSALGRGLRSLRGRVPGACPLCGQRTLGARLCAFCQHAVMASMQSAGSRCPRCCLALDPQGQCADCVGRNFSFGRVFAAFDYAHPGDLLIRYFKVQRRFGLAPVLAEMAAQALAQGPPGLFSNPDFVVPVPSHAAALRERGFNPSAELVSCLCAGQGWRADYRLLVHKGSVSIAQKHLGREQRAEQARSRYHCTRRVQGAQVLVVDDVFTTGSTLNAAAQALLDAGAAAVNGLVLARTPHRRAGFVQQAL